MSNGEPYQPALASQGWECPKCGSVWAIWVDRCKHCENSNVKLTYTTWTGNETPMTGGTTLTPKESTK
jgi:predicted RNA-binding Zn-ribbon protein involved in translation (DUF1610 family)